MFKDNYIKIIVNKENKASPFKVKIALPQPAFGTNGNSFYN